LALEGRYRGGDELHAAFSVQVAVDGPDLGTQLPDERGVLLHQDRDLQALLAGGGRDL
jgi:hypothetical protein